MNRDVVTQLRDYFEYVDEAQGAVDVLTVPVKQPVTPVGPTPAGQPGQRRRLWLVAAASATAVLVLVGGAALLFGAIGEDDGSTAASFVADATIPIGDVPTHLAVGADALWVAHGWSVSRVDPTANAVTATVDLRSTTVGLLAGPDAVWVSSVDGKLRRLDPETGLVVGEFQTESGTRELGWWQVLAADGDTVWAIHTITGNLLRIDPNTDELEATVIDTPSSECQGNGFGAVALGEDAVWAVSPHDGCLTRINSETGQLETRLKVGGGSTDNAGPNYVAIGDDRSVWVTYQGGSGLPRQDSATMFRIDPASNEVIAQVTVEAGAYGVVGRRIVCVGDELRN